MATNTIIGVSDPSVARQVERQTTQENLISGNRGTVVTGNEVIYNQAVTSTGSNSVTITQSVNNDSGDITTVYSTPGTISVTAVDQRVNQYSVFNTGVAEIIAGNNITISSTIANGKGEVTINATTAGSNYGDSNVSSLLASFGSNTISTTGNVSVGNISATNLGNIIGTNYDGNASNVLHGDGTWSADVTDYGNSNVVSLLAAFGSNTISTTGLITGDGGGLSNVPYANVTGTPSLGNISALNLDGNASNLLSGAGTYVAIPVVPTIGNIASINLDGNVSNVLRGDGTWAPDSAGTYGDSNVTTLLGAFGSNTIVTTGIITADGANLSNVPYANLTGAPSLGNISSINLDGNSQTWLAGNGVFANIAIPTVGNIATLNLDGNASNLLTGAGTYVAIPTVPTVGNIATLNLDGNSQTWLAGNGVFANIAIPSVGNIAVINLDGNASNVLRGDGTFSADANSSYGDSNVTSLLGAFGSNTISTTGNIAVGAMTASDKIGYSAGGNATQSGSGASVTINQLTGKVTLFNTSWTAGSPEAFTISCNKVSADNYILAQVVGSSNGASFIVNAYPHPVLANTIQVIANPISSLTDTITLQFVILQTPTS